MNHFRLSCLLFVALVVINSVMSLSFDDDVEEEVDEDDRFEFAKRGAKQFARMVKQVTGRSVRAYLNYGCWCGLRKSSGVPVDATDRCCRTHDNCLYSTPCRTWQISTVPYFHRGSKCIRDFVTTRCGRALCRCDSAAAECFKTASYNRKYKGWPSSKCRNPQK